MRLLALAILVTALASLLAAVYAGWKLHNANPGRRLSITVKRPVRVISDETFGSRTVPNVLGLDGPTARQALVDSGIAGDHIRLVDVPYAGDRGIVVGQDPKPGAPRPQDAVLSVSSDAPMPRLVGQDAESARDVLAGYGVRVLQATRFVPGKAEGVVLGTHPAAGESLAETATLTVAEPPLSAFLDALEPIDSDCGTGALTMDAHDYPHTITCSAYEGSVASARYLLNRRVSTFTAVAGLDDRGDTGTVRFTVRVDGRPALSRDVAFGHPRRISVPVDGALRLSIEAKVVAGGDGSLDVGWGNAKLAGGEAAIDAVVKASSP